MDDPLEEPYMWEIHELIHTSYKRLEKPLCMLLYNTYNSTLYYVYYIEVSGAEGVPRIQF